MENTAKLVIPLLSHLWIVSIDFAVVNADNVVDLKVIALLLLSISGFISLFDIWNCR